ncbi:MAG: hypothetical protein HUJ56_04170 [Erysipelotrichaceae bacterium]|nr:hypothetical protein [Erysipelotrichaceae bacterium]
MKKNLLFILRSILFTGVAIGVFLLVNVILLPKYMYNHEWPTTATFTKFYELEDNSVDVLFFGTSNGASAFNPAVLYEQEGIRSYSLACEQQNLLTSYYWLKEALRFQKPKVVVLDPFILFEFRKEEPLNTEEPTQRKAFDYMKWSSVKREAVKAICSIDESQDEMSYYFTNIRFHNRWKGLELNDFDFLSIKQHKDLFGFSALRTLASDFDYYQPLETFKTEEIWHEDTGELEFVTVEATDLAEPDDVMLIYFEKINELCKQENIELVLCKTLHYEWTIEQHNYIQDFAFRNGLTFIDYNMKDMYEAAGLSFMEDNADGVHMNVWGSRKATSYLGTILKNKGISAKPDNKYDELVSYYHEVLEECDLVKEENFIKYLQGINQDKYIVFMAIKDEGTKALNSECMSALQALGLKENLIGELGTSYIAVIDQGVIHEAKSVEDKLAYSGYNRDGSIAYSVTSAGVDAGNECSIVLNGIDYAANTRGFNIVVYNNETKTVIDQRAFDTYTSVGD